MDCEETIFPVRRLKYTFPKDVPIWQGEDSMFFLNLRKKGKKNMIMTRPWKFRGRTCEPMLDSRDVSLIRKIFQDINMDMVTVRTEGDERIITLWFKKTGPSALTRETAAKMLEENIPQIDCPFQNCSMTFIHL